MYIRKKKNKSGSISIQIIEKKHSQYKVVKTIGCAKNKKRVRRTSPRSTKIISKT